MDRRLAVHHRQLRRGDAETPHGVAASKPGEWVTAFGYDGTLMTGPPQMTRDNLDTIAPNNPVFVLHISEHNAYLNSLALAAAKLTDATPDVAQGRYLRDAHGRLLGVAEEVTALARIVAAMPAGAGRASWG